MINLAIGIALGAAFSKMWIALFDAAMATPLGVKVAAFFGKK